MKRVLFVMGLVLITNVCWANTDVSEQVDDVATESVVVATDVDTTQNTGAVAQRVNCDDVQAQITELGAAEQTQDVLNEIARLKSEYRRSCSRSAGARRTSVAGRVVIENPTDKSGTDVAEVSEEESLEQKTQPEPQADVAQELTLEQELANLDAGLCADGSAPNKFGCCADEIFKDLGNTVFACCPRAGGDCFPPLK